MLKISKRLLPFSAVTLSTVLILNMCIIGNTTQVTANDDNYDITEKINVALSRSLAWLEGSQNSNGSWGNADIINDTCYSISTLSDNGYDVATGVQWLSTVSLNDNVDTLSRKLYATHTKNSYAKSLIGMQNADGGFGVDKNYRSEVYDTVLAFEAFATLDTSAYDSNTQKMLSYLADSQNDDGSFSCSQYNDAEETLTARIVYDTMQYLNSKSLNSSKLLTMVSSAQTYLSSTTVTNFDMEENQIEGSLYYALFKQAKGDYTEVYDIGEVLTAYRGGSFL